MDYESDWADEIANIICERLTPPYPNANAYWDTMPVTNSEFSALIATHLRAAERRGRAMGMREAADMMDGFEASSRDPLQGDVWGLANKEAGSVISALPLPTSNPPHPVKATRRSP